jgi:hypothetical protein
MPPIAFSQLARGVVRTQVGAIASLLAAAWILSLLQGPRYESFFTYRSPLLDHTPIWFVACLLLLAFNGFWLFRLAFIGGAFATPPGSPWGQWSVEIHLNAVRIFAVNLIAIPAILLGFVVIRSLGL